MSFGGKPSTPSPKSQSPRAKVELKGDAKVKQRSIPSSLGDKSPRTKDGAAQEAEARSPVVKSPSKGVTPAAELVPTSPTSGEKQVKRRVRSSLGGGDEPAKGLNSSPAAAKVDEKKLESKMDDKKVSKQDEKAQPVHSQALKSEERKQQSPKLDAKKQPIRHDIKKGLGKADERKVTGKPDAKSPTIKSPVGKPAERKPVGSSEKKHQSPSPLSSSQKNKPVDTVPGGPPEGQGIVSKVLSPSSASKSQVQPPVVPKSSAGKSVEEDLWTCRECGWTYPNPHPSAKHRRNHKKHCSEIKEKKEKGHHVDGGSSDDASSDDESSAERGRSAKPVVLFVEPGDVTASPEGVDAGVGVVDVQPSGLSGDEQGDTALPKEGIQAQRLDKNSLRSLSVKARVEDYEKKFTVDDSSPRTPTPGRKNVVPRAPPYSSPAKRLLFPEKVPVLEPTLDHVAESGSEEQVASQPAEATSNLEAVDNGQLPSQALDTVVSTAAGKELKAEALQSSFSDAPGACKKSEEPETSPVQEVKTGEPEIDSTEVHSGEVKVLESAGQVVSSTDNVEVTEVQLEESNGLLSGDLQGGGAEKASTEGGGCDPLGVIEGGAAEQLEITIADSPQKVQSEVPGDTYGLHIPELPQAVDSEPELATQADDVIRKNDIEKDVPVFGEGVFAPGVAESHNQVQHDELSSAGAEVGTSIQARTQDLDTPETVEAPGGEPDGILEPSKHLDHDGSVGISGVKLDPDLDIEESSDQSKGTRPSARISEVSEPSLTVDGQLEFEDAHNTGVGISSQLEDTLNQGSATPERPVADSEQALNTRIAVGPEPPVADTEQPLNTRIVVGEEPVPEVAHRKVTFADDLKKAEDCSATDKATSLSVDVDLLKPAEPESAQEVFSSVAEPSSCDPVILPSENGLSDVDLDSSHSVAVVMERDHPEDNLPQLGVESLTAQSDTSAVAQEHEHAGGQALGENDGHDAAVVQSQIAEPEAKPEIEVPVTRPVKKVHGTAASITESREKELWEQLLDNDLKHYSADNRSDAFPAEDSWKPDVEEKLLQNSGRLTADLQGEDTSQHSGQTQQETVTTTERSEHAGSGVTPSTAGQGVLDKTHIQEGVDRDAAPETVPSLASTTSEHELLNRTGKELSESEGVAPVDAAAEPGPEIAGGGASSAYQDPAFEGPAASPIRVQSVTGEEFSKSEVSVENGGQSVEKQHHHRLRNLLEEEHVAEHLEVQPSQETKVVASPKSPFLKRIIERVRSSPPSLADNAAKETGSEDIDAFPRAKRSMFSCQCFSPTDPK